MVCAHHLHRLGHIGGGKRIVGHAMQSVVNRDADGTAFRDCRPVSLVDAPVPRGLPQVSRYRATVHEHHGRARARGPVRHIKIDRTMTLRGANLDRQDERFLVPRVIHPGSLRARGNWPAVLTCRNQAAGAEWLRNSRRARIRSAFSSSLGQDEVPGVFVVYQMENPVSKGSGAL